MAIAIHLGKIDKMSYDFKELDHDVWPVHLAYKVFRTHPKFIFQMSTSSIQLSERETHTSFPNTNDDSEQVRYSLVHDFPTTPPNENFVSDAA